MEKVSVIIPIYNGELYLKRCVESLINQTYKNIELIFVNDGSTDETLQILNSYAKEDNRIIIINKKNTGVSDSRNLAIKKATGKYICFCDADDFYQNNYIEVMYNLINKYDVDIVRCNYQVIDKQGKQVEAGNNLYTDKVLDNTFIVNNIIPLCLNGKMPCFTYLLMIKKETLHAIFPTDIAMMEDVVFYINLLINTEKMYTTNSPLYTIMFNDNGATNNVKNYERNILNIVLVNKNIKQILKSNNLLSNDNIQKLNVNHLNAIADFIFKYYLAGENAVHLCKNILTSELIDLIENTDISQINWVRRTILKLLYLKKYKTLQLYFMLRSIVYKLKRRRT